LQEEQDSEEDYDEDEEEDQEHDQDEEQDPMQLDQECWFDHEKLEVYREAIAFIAWLSELLEGTVRIVDVKDQLDRASTSIPLNLAEGNGKYAPKDRCRFFDIAHASALECAAGLDVLVAKGKLTSNAIRPGKERLQRVVRMLMGLIKRNSNRDYDKAKAAE
jgi:four helix bundle protein